MLPAFEEYSFCPVCEEPRFGILNAERLRKFFYKFHFHPVVDGKCMKIKDLTDEDSDIRVRHLHVTCSKCGYEWIERVAPQSDDYEE